MKDAYIEIKPLHLIGEDERGATYDYSVRENSDYILIHRKQGTKSGNTFHKGVSLATNPKIFVLMSGSLMFSYRHVEHRVHESIFVDKPSIIMIQPLVTHAVEALTDIMILECNSIKDIQDDRYVEPVDLTADQRV